MREEFLYVTLLDLNKVYDALDRSRCLDSNERQGGEREHGERRLDTTSDEENWARVVEFVQTEFRDGDLAEEATWQAVVLIPKGKGDYRGIGLVEVMWKVVAVILNRRFTSSITFHNVLHGFWAGRGTGTATLETKRN